ncbi:MAG: phosphoglycerate kinase [Bacteroidetes bacterium]|nr:phosphoglycerate kinase [Rhodothermia bacterium]MCS7154906.1 phosphoglycerate kinase [Bacteroidota bacterium]MCX7906935.1 phosphoglycerate kinase [Bacteroidota bacterium]MDW8137701.1 phosphoglycerate kinase [Bacteroidota bacterium]MDW8285345.1 phosphoglycerate kinase [Bacteroidota bacterium]
MGWRKKTIDDVPVSGRRVFLRVDFNVPLEGGRIVDDRRIRAALPTIRRLLACGARLVVGSHLGRPKGVEPSLSLRPIAERLEALLGQPVHFVPEVSGPAVEEAVGKLAEGAVLMLENLRFHPGEERNDPELARQWAAWTELYVNDAFGASHRAHASIEALPRMVGTAVAGYLLQRELEYLVGALENPARPFVLVLGGAKVSDKILVLENLIGRIDRLLIGGGMAYTFLRASGREVGRSLLEPERLSVAEAILERARALGVPVELPQDHVVARALDDPEPPRIASDSIPDDYMGLDIGPQTAARYAALLREARTVLWNGPMGVFEVPRFATGTQAVAQALAEATRGGAITIVGGGDSAAALDRLGLAEAVSHLSTGGGAALELLEGRQLPGLLALQGVS